LYDIGLALFAQRLLIPDGLGKLDSFFPDHQTRDVRHFDARSYDILS
jgi:hypothetical protein